MTKEEKFIKKYQPCMDDLCAERIKNIKILRHKYDFKEKIQNRRENFKEYYSNCLKNYIEHIKYYGNTNINNNNYKALIYYAEDEEMFLNDLSRAVGFKVQSRPAIISSLNSHIIEKIKDERETD